MGKILYKNDDLEEIELNQEKIKIVCGDKEFKIEIYEDSIIVNKNTDIDSKIQINPRYSNEIEIN